MKIANEFELTADGFRRGLSPRAFAEINEARKLLDGQLVNRAWPQRRQTVSKRRENYRRWIVPRVARSDKYAHSQLARAIDKWKNHLSEMKGGCRDGRS